MVSRLSIVVTISSVVVLESALFFEKGSALLQDNFIVLKGIMHMA